MDSKPQKGKRNIHKGYKLYLNKNVKLMFLFYATTAKTGKDLAKAIGLTSSRFKEKEISDRADELIRKAKKKDRTCKFKVKRMKFSCFKC